MEQATRPIPRTSLRNIHRNKILEIKFLNLAGPSPIYDVIAQTKISTYMITYGPIILRPAYITDHFDAHALQELPSS